jgi:diaminopimelate epimerase
MIEFAKMHGLGNDFMVLDLVSQDYALSAEQIRQWADRHTGVGFDQLLTVEPPTQPDADFRYRIYNADGEEAEQCGNGARCVAVYITHRQLSRKPKLLLQTQAGRIQTAIVDSTNVEVDMGAPRLAAGEVPFADAHGTEAGPMSYLLEANAERCEVTPVSMGNPHGVLFVDNIAQAPVAEIGAQLTAHPFFPEGANIGFCQIVDPGFIRLRVFERGVGETRACGSGACAAMAAGRLHGLLGERVKVSLPGGKIRVCWQGRDATIRMTGPATLVFEGSINI